jgi:hypothetical protein
MKRNWDLIREILVAAEAKPVGQLLFNSELQGHDSLDVAAHIAMLHDAGFVTATMNRSAMMTLDASINEITFDGYDLLDTLRSESTWAKIKATAKSKSIELSFEQGHRIKTL